MNCLCEYIFVLCASLCVSMHSSFEICIFDLFTNIFLLITILELAAKIYTN